MKHEILVINKAIRYKILLKLKVLDLEKLHGILWTFVKYCKIVFQLSSIFTKVVEILPILDNIRQHLTVFPSDFNNIYLKYFSILQNLMRNYEILQKFTKFNESHDIPRYFLGQITLFHSVLSNYEALLAFRDFVLWQTKFFYLLSYHFTFRQHQQIFCHHQTKRDFYNITDT